MPAVKMDGSALAKKTRAELAVETQRMKEEGIEPHLAVILVGDDPASTVYVRNKEKACIQTGVRSTVIRLGNECDQATLEETVSRLNAAPDVHGILVQLPLPKHLNTARVLSLIDPKKDVDGFHAVNCGLLLSGREGFVPCTPRGVMEILAEYGIDPRGKHAVVVGRSNIVGKPMALLLLGADATVTICHSRTVDLPSVTRSADILIAAVGRRGFITKDMVKPGAVVIDVGINRKEEGGVCGDVEPDVADVAGYMTPVPGGVGPMTIAMLLKNTLDAARRYGA
ncbi:MAG: bifunctional methylenetetrahydrofolate dehydrogenase/methenyltetrahydrofolate cyclohydrolase FolD [Clostridia bacterium]|nr:bifunctional methylenetetrahydrofolate dehydrogenase/methenyltetrahydrofolate cyclohydrolase FolD [Clostridia bacterium]